MVFMMINMRVFKTILVLILTIINLNDAAPSSALRLEHRELEDDIEDVPVTNPTTTASTTTTATISQEDNYDQRQNGTENYQIHVDGLVVVVAPVEALLLAGGAVPGLGDDFFSGLTPAGGQKPGNKPSLQPAEEKPVIPSKPNENHKKSAHRPHLRLVSLLAPFLKRAGPH